MYSRYDHSQHGTMSMEWVEQEVDWAVNWTVDESKADSIIPTSRDKGSDSLDDHGREYEGFSKRRAKATQPLNPVMALWTCHVRHAGAILDRFRRDIVDEMKTFDTSKTTVEEFLRLIEAIGEVINDTRKAKQTLGKTQEALASEGLQTTAVAGHFCTMQDFYDSLIKTFHQQSRLVYELRYELMPYELARAQGEMEETANELD